jgi:nucleotide-binding universal stress UspA family protein
MKLLERVLAAVDFDDTSPPLLAVAAILAKQFGSEVVLLHTVEPADEAIAGGAAKLDAIIRTRLEEMGSELVATGVEVPRLLVTHGKPLAEITATAERLSANLIMLGARAVAASRNLSLGTTTEKVIRKSAKPVLAVHPEHPLAFTNILCPVDFSDASARGLTSAIQLARAFHGKLHVLTVMPPPSKYHRLDHSWGQWAVTAEAAAASRHVREFDEFLCRFDFRDVQWQKNIARGDPAEEIVASAKSENADLIVMGSVGRTGLPYVLMGSTAVKVARQLPCSLLTVKHEESSDEEFTSDVKTINILYAEGRELLAAKSYEAAIAKFNQVLGHDPYHPAALQGRADAFDRLGHAQEAERSRRRAKAIEQTEEPQYDLGGGD